MCRKVCSYFTMRLQNNVSKNNSPKWFKILALFLTVVVLISVVNLFRSSGSRGYLSAYPIRGTWYSSYTSNEGRVFSRTVVFSVGNIVSCIDKSGLTVRESKASYITYAKDGHSFAVIRGVDDFPSELTGVFWYNATNDGLFLEDEKTHEVVELKKNVI